MQDCKILRSAQIPMLDPYVAIAIQQANSELNFDMADIVLEKDNNVSVFANMSS